MQLDLGNDRIIKPSGDGRKQMQMQRQREAGKDAKETSLSGYLQLAHYSMEEYGERDVDPYSGSETPENVDSFFFIA